MVYEWFKLGNAVATSPFVFSISAVKACNVFKLDSRRSKEHRSAEVLIARVRADKNPKAAEHRFTKWYHGEDCNMNKGWYRCNLNETLFFEAKARSPHKLHAQV